MQAILSNPNHPEYGVATIPFPIPDAEYDHVIELLNPLEIGDFAARDCRVEEITDAPPILSKLEQSMINLDELDYLAKRLDGFDYYELEQFQALTHTREHIDIQEMINLTFNSQQVTVVSDFTKLEAAGKDHYLTVHGGGAPLDEFEKVDGMQEALNLLAGQKGQITPYGVLFDNGMTFEQFYDGGNFPLYGYKPPLMEVTLAQDHLPKLELLLPMPEKQLERMLLRAGMDEAHCQISEYSSQFPDEVDAAIDFRTDSVLEINRLCNALSGFTQQDFAKLAAATQMAKPEYSSETRQLAENLELFSYFPDIHSDEDLGIYMIQESGHFEYDPNLEDYYNYEGYGHDWLAERSFTRSTRGIITYDGAMTLDELMREDPAEQPIQIIGME